MAMEMEMAMALEMALDIRDISPMMLPGFTENSSPLATRATTLPSKSSARYVASSPLLRNCSPLDTYSSSTAISIRLKTFMYVISFIKPETQTIIQQ